MGVFRGDGYLGVIFGVIRGRSEGYSGLEQAHCSRTCQGGVLATNVTLQAIHVTLNVTLWMYGSCLVTKKFGVGFNFLSK